MYHQDFKAKTIKINQKTYIKLQPNPKHSKKKRYIFNDDPLEFKGEYYSKLWFNKTKEKTKEVTSNTKGYKYDKDKECISSIT